jgi:hypothetical protein
MEVDPRMFSAAKAGWEQALRLLGADTVLHGKTLAELRNEDLARREARFLARLPHAAARLYPSRT